MGRIRAGGLGVLAIPHPFRYFPAARAPGPRRGLDGCPRRGAGVVERDGLENRYTLTGIEGSNPSPSAIFTCRLPI